jgi:hypothetical protein
MRYVQRADGREAIPDDMPPSTRAVAFLIEHANQRRDDGLPLPCPCAECVSHRGAVRCTKLADGTLVIEPA